ncbi:hypothetical protein KAX08_05615 [candidate division WOR-3 bacterium]|nr:hypothetical protein [candidate division WOR-3 bacterium]
MNNEEFKESNPHSVGTGKVFQGNSKLEVTKETYKDRNINFRKYVKGLMLGMLSHNAYKTLNLERKTYIINLRLSIVPEKEGLIYIPAEEQRKKIELAKKQMEEAKKKLIKVIE